MPYDRNYSVVEKSLFLNNQKKRLESTEKQSYRNILRIAWTEHVSHEKVFKEM